MSGDNLPKLDPNLVPFYTEWKSENPEPEYGMWDYLDAKANLDLAAVFSKLFWPDFIEVGDCIFLAEQYPKWSDPPEDLSRLSPERRQSYEALVNHVHIYDLFPAKSSLRIEPPDGGPIILRDAVYSLELKEYLAQVLLVSWKHALMEAYPDKKFEFSYGTEPYEHGPTVSFWQVD
jgi:hypothetical protein